MRTLKKTLCLVLVLAMVLSLGVTNIFAATDFSDDADIEFKEATSVLDAIGVIQGNGDGTFNPKGSIQRAQACAIIARLVAPDLDVRNAGYTTDAFSDVTADKWYMSEIAYCYALGYVAGNGDGTFGPEDYITGTAFAKLLLVALGYDAEKEGMQNNPSWQVNIDRLARSAGTTLHNGITGLNLTNELSRDRAAQMSLNALKANMVYYDATTGKPVPLPGNGVNGTDYRTNGGNSDTNTQLIEQYFPSLMLINSGSPLDEDAFNRPVASQWAFDTTGNGTPDSGIYVVSEKTTKAYTSAVTSTDFNKDFPTGTNGYTLKNNKFDNDGSSAELYVNGEDKSATATATAYAGGVAITSPSGLYRLTGNGKVVEIYADSARVIHTVVVIDYKVGIVDEIKTNEETGDTTYRILKDNGDLLASGVVYADNEKDGDNTVVFNGGTYAKGDVVTYAVVEDAVNDGNDDALYLWPTTCIEGVQTGNRVSNSVRTVTLNGDTSKSYTVGVSTMDGKNNNTMFASNTDADENWGFYFDQYGYLVYKQEIVEDEEDTADEYAVILKIAKVKGGMSDTSTQADLLFTDGSVKKNANIKLVEAGFSSAQKIVADEYAENYKNWYGVIVTYELGDDGVYELTNATANEGKDASNEADGHMVGGSNGTYSALVTKNGTADFYTNGYNTSSTYEGKEPQTKAASAVATNKTVFLVATGGKADGTERAATDWGTGGANAVKYLTKAGTTKYDVYTGYSEVPDITIAAGKIAEVTYAATDDDGVVVVFIDYGNAVNNVAEGDATKSEDILYVADNGIETEGTDPVIYKMEGYVNGTTKETLTAENGVLSTLEAPKLNKGGLYMITSYDADGNVATIGSDTTNANKADGKPLALVELGAKPANGVVNIGGSKTYDNSKTTAYVITNNYTGNGTFKIEKGYVEDAAKGDEVYAIYKKNANGDNTSEIDTLYIIKTTAKALELEDLEATGGNIVVKTKAIDAGKTVTNPSTQITVSVVNKTAATRTMTAGSQSFSARVASVVLTGTANTGDTLEITFKVKADDGTVYKVVKEVTMIAT